MSAERPHLLVVEDDLDIAEMLNAYFRVQGFEVQVANYGEDGVKYCFEHHPDLVILDIRLPDIDGFEVAKRIKDNRRTQNIPIIFLTDRREREDRLRGLALNPQDYVTKPFDVQELRLRVRNALRSNAQGPLTNPITNLPTGGLVDERLMELMGQHHWAILLVSIQNLDFFREVYGFVASDDLLRAASLMLHDAVNEVGAPNDFIGHLGPADFILVVEPESVSGLKDRMHKRLEVSMGYFYKEQDRQSGVFDKHPLGVHFAHLTSDQIQIKDLESFRNQLINLTKG